MLLNDNERYVKNEIGGLVYIEQRDIAWNNSNSIPADGCVHLNLASNRWFSLGGLNSAARISVWVPPALSPSPSPSRVFFPFHHTSHIWRVMSRSDCFDMLYECKGRSREQTAKDGEWIFKVAAHINAIRREETRGTSWIKFDTPAISLFFFSSLTPYAIKEELRRNYQHNFSHFNLVTKQKLFCLFIYRPQMSLELWLRAILERRNNLISQSFEQH